MQLRALLVPLVALAGCAADPLPAPSCDDGASGDYGVDIALQGLEADTSYFFEIVSEGQGLLVAKTPEQPNTYDETPLDGNRHLVVGLFEQTLRIYVEEADGSGTGPEIATIVVWSGGTMLTRATFTPAYEDAAPVSEGCNSFSVVTEQLRVPTARRF